MSWRIIATVTTVALVYIFTGEVALAASVGFFDFGSKMFFYYAHERAWGWVKWGRE